MKTVLALIAIVVVINALFFALRLVLPFAEAVQWGLGAVLTVLGFALSQSQSIRAEVGGRGWAGNLDEQATQRLFQEKAAQERRGLVIGTVGMSLILSGLFL